MMWPFKKKRELQGIEKNKEENFTVYLTEEEKQAIDDIFKMFEGYGIHRDYTDDFQKGTIAYALSMYAKEQVMKSETESKKENRKIMLDKAIAAIMKAYNIYDLPIYIYDMACFMEMADRIDISRNGFREFIKKESEYEPRHIDEAFLKNRDTDEAIKDAKLKVK